jgi:hypothetical protein
MEPVRTDPESWTGRDPSRRQVQLMSPAAQEKLDNFSFALGCFGLVLVGYQLGTFEKWQDFIIPIGITGQGFLMSARVWHRATRERSEVGRS